MVRLYTAVLCLVMLMAGCAKEKDNAIHIGVIAELTGDIPAVGASCKNAAEMAVKSVNDKGGLEIGGKKYAIKLQIEDSAGRSEQAASAAQKLITRDKVIAIVGPNASSGAIPASEIAETSKIPMISPWSTNPKTTIDPRSGKQKGYVFRACYMDSFQGRVLAAFAMGELKAKKAAVLYDVASEVLKGQAEVFKKTLEEKGGTITGFETYTTGNKDFTVQMTKIKNGSPELIFLPTYYSDVPLQVQQARRFGITEPVLGSDAWGSHDLLALCGKDCDGAFFSSHFSANSTTPGVKKFVDDYKALYGSVPDDVAALTYDSFGIMFEAMKRAGKPNSEAIKNAIQKITGFKGVTGDITFHEGSGDPDKSVVILQIKDGEFKWFADIKP
ncbi:ABC transporter substrate-binding protein [Candidatus Magnetominusculus xianensis]|uniref:Ethanolamine utilization protein EutJ n=1 Tax=Candidatus Magnetominusculus xianensis TaxID=1748249 RepID=A0ABR5SEH8_9BACT|nr:ABC transporter substrate-binding protein [Candidatus Magnetominusculus xianensis]KWT82507.1 ethanolamine utilization protein EutJ [Candidatus Magnetominusculus xianensis]MBF0405413.1 ABC transporter substrate-binding protein [Nitrospirota bacterium]